MHPLLISTVFLDADDQLRIDADFTEFIDDDGAASTELLRQEMIENRCLSGPEKAGKNRNPDLSHANSQPHAR
jgi:hypothetical protein